MDVLAHTLWTNAVFHLKYHQQRKMRYLAAFFGVAPDLVGFAPLFGYMILSGRLFRENFPFTPTNWTFGFAEQAYNYTHSLVIFILTAAVVLLAGNLYRYFKHQSKFSAWFIWPMFGWALHILLDIPTHPNFFHTPFLFPLSDYRFTGGVSWAHPKFMLINYGLMILVYSGLFYYQKKHGQK